MIFIIQNTRTVQISFLGAHARLSLAGALPIATAGTVRITQLRRAMRRTVRRLGPGGQGHLAAGITRRDRHRGPARQEPKPHS